VKMSRIAIVDIDGCLCPSIFANIKHNDNNKLKSAEFEQALAEVEPYTWARDWDWSENQYRTIIVITGRLYEWNYITAKWLVKLFNSKFFELINVEWNDSYATREESYKDYVRRKVESIIYHVEKYDGEHADIFEDDKNILDGLRPFSHIVDFDNITLYLVKNGIMGEL